MSIPKRTALTFAVIVVALAAWGALAVTQLGYVWPYPLILPSTISFHGGTYYKQTGCHSRRWWDEHGGLSGAETARRLGTLPSALVIGGSAEYGLHGHAHNGYVLVPSGRCIVMYLSTAN